MESKTIEISSERDLSEARFIAKSMCQEMKLSALPMTKFITAVSELGRNMLNHAGKGKITFTPGQNKRGVPKISAIFEDEGPGIQDVEKALQDGFSTGGSMGLGLPGAKRLCREFEVISSLGNGTQITISQW